MQTNLDENILKLKKYIDTKNYDDIDILDLMKYVANNYGANFKKNTSIQTLEQTIKLKQKVVFILVDGLGYYKVNSLKEDSILKRNCIQAIDTINPTSTACVLTSLATGKYPSEHGIFGWWSYDKNHDINYYPLLFINRKSGVSLKDENVDTDQIYNCEPIFNKFNHNVNIILNNEIINSEYSKWFAGNKGLRYGSRSIRDAFNVIDKKLKQGDKFNYLYIDGLDLTSHCYGINSKEANDVIFEIEQEITRIKNSNDDTTIIVTADHGQIDMASMIYLNQNYDYSKYFYALPSIDTRIISFYIKPEFLEEFKEKFLEEFKQDVILLKTDEIEKYKIFGNTTFSKYAKNSLGEYIAIVVNDKFMVCDEISKNDKLYTKGNHSGLTQSETKIPLIVI